jgi:hypothetical protein
VDYENRIQPMAERLENFPSPVSVFSFIKTNLILFREEKEHMATIKDKYLKILIVPKGSL